MLRHLHLVTFIPQVIYFRSQRDRLVVNPFSTESRFEEVLPLCFVMLKFPISEWVLCLHDVAEVRFMFRVLGQRFRFLTRLGLLFCFEVFEEESLQEAFFDLTELVLLLIVFYDLEGFELPYLLLHWKLEIEFLSLVDMSAWKWFSEFGRLCGRFCRVVLENGRTVNLLKSLVFRRLSVELFDFYFGTQLWIRKALRNSEFRLLVQSVWI